MDTKEMQGHSECEKCGMCWHRRWVRILVKIVVVLFVFWIGVQVGELKGVLRASYGYGMMGSYDRQGNWSYGFPGMMGGWFRETVSQPATTSKW